MGRLAVSDQFQVDNAFFLHDYLIDSSAVQGNAKIGRYLTQSLFSTVGTTDFFIVSTVSIQRCSA